MKTKLLLLSTFFFGISFLSSAQNFNNNQKSTGAPNIDLSKAIVLYDNTGFLITGYEDTTGNHIRIYLIYLDSNGDTVWTKAYDSHLPGGLTGMSVAQTSDSGIVMGANVQGFNGTHQDALIVKTDNMGNFQWAKTIEDSINQSMFYNPMVCKGFSNDIAEASVDQDASGSSVIDLSIFSNNGNEILALKLHAPGTVNYITDIEQAPFGFGFLIYGYTNVNGNNREFCIQITPLGALVHVYENGGSTGSTYSTCITPTTSNGMPNGYLMCGYTNSFGAGNYDGYVVKTDLSFNTLWAKTYGGTGDDRIYACKQISDNKFIMGGITNGYGAGGFDGLLFSTDSMGNLIKAKAIGGSMDDYIYGLAINNSGNLVAVGGTKSYGAGLSDAWISVFPQVVNQFRMSSINAACNEDSIALTETTPASISDTTVAFAIDSGGLVFTFRTLYAVSGISVMADICSSTAISEPAPLSSVTIFPNPSSGTFTVSFNQPFGKCALKIFNLLGEKVYSEEFASDISKQTSKEISLQLSPGVYIVNLSNDVEQSIHKLVFH